MGGAPEARPERVLRAVLTDARAGGRGIRASWHTDAGLVVLSLWRGPDCVATARLSPAEAGRLAGLLSDGLDVLAEQTPRGAEAR